MSLLTTAKRTVSGPAIGTASVLLIAGLVPTGFLFGSGSAGVAIVDAGLVRVGLDVWLHALGYGALAAALVLTADRISWPVLLSTVVVATAFGAVVELLQVPLPWRTGSSLDGLANGIGAVLGAGIASVVRVVRCY